MNFMKILIFTTLLAMFSQGSIASKSCLKNCWSKSTCTNDSSSESEAEEETSFDSFEEEWCKMLLLKTDHPDGTIHKEGKLNLPKNLDFKLDHLLIVGIGGPTRSGKSTFGDKLHQLLEETENWDVKSIEMDSFFDMRLMEQMYFDGRPHCNWETPAGVNWLELSNYLQELNELAKNELPKGKKRIILMNGFLCFNQEWLRKKFVYSIFVNIDYTTCKKRRMATKRVPVPYFDHCIWNGFQQYGQFPENYDGPFAQFDGSKNAIQNVQEFIHSKHFSTFLEILSPSAATMDEVSNKFYDNKLNKKL